MLHDNNYSSSISIGIFLRLGILLSFLSRQDVCVSLISKRALHLTKISKLFVSHSALESDTRAATNIQNVWISHRIKIGGSRFIVPGDYVVHEEYGY